MRRLSGIFKVRRQSLPPKIERVDVCLTPPYGELALSNQYRYVFSGQKDEAPDVPIMPFCRHFPTDVFQIIVEIYVRDCRSSGDIAGISRFMRSSRLMHLWLGPEVYRFVSLNNFDDVTSFSQSLRTARRYTKAIDVSSEVSPYAQTSATMRSIALRLEGRLEKLCLPPNYIIPSSTQGGSVFVRDVTILYNYRTKPGHLRCKRLRLTLSHPEVERSVATLAYQLPFNTPLWISLHHLLNSFAFEITGDNINTLSTIYEVVSDLKFTALEQCVAIIWFNTQTQIDEFRKHSQSLVRIPSVIPRPYKLRVIYLSEGEYEEWTFGSLEWRGEDFWEKIATRFEQLD